MDVQTWKWTRVEYERLTEAEILGPEDRVELLGGAMICKEPQDSPHATSVLLAQRALSVAFREGWLGRAQMPVALDDESQPEPDVVPAIRATTVMPTRRGRRSSSKWRRRRSAVRLALRSGARARSSGARGAARRAVGTHHRRRSVAVAALFTAVTQTPLRR
jgi:putative restriction endonuclease